MCVKCALDNKLCQYYIQNNNIEFKIVFPKQGDRYEGHKFPHSSLNFILEGEVMFSYNDFLNRHFKRGELLFLPQSTEIIGIALEDTKMLIMNSKSLKSLCDTFLPDNYTNELKKIEYTFSPLQLTPTMLKFVELIENYISTNIKCKYLDELKQKELFVLMGNIYSKTELLKLFYPVIGGNLDFKSRILDNYSHFISVEELTKKFGMCYTSFLRKFKAEFGETAKEWMLKQKAKHIILRLSIPETTITDIIREFNFTDASHFTRYCKKQYGCTPTELIKQIRSQYLYK